MKNGSASFARRTGNTTAVIGCVNMVGVGFSFFVAFTVFNLKDMNYNIQCTQHTLGATFFPSPHNPPNYSL